MLFVWIALSVACVIAEILTKRWIAIFGIPAALVALILSLISAPVPMQLGVFAALALIGVVLSYVLFYKTASKDTDLSHVIGHIATVTEDIDDTSSCGQVCINGQYWAARAIHPTDCFASGSIVRIVAIEGVKLICTRVEDQK